MVACVLVVVWPWYWPKGNHNGSRLKADFNYGCLKVYNYVGHTQQTALKLFIINLDSWV